MKTLRVLNLAAIALLCVLTFNSTNLFAQRTAPAPVPVGPPMPAGNPLFPIGPLPLLTPQRSAGPGVPIIQNYDGIDFLGSNCGCLPPDTNAAVGNSYVTEAVNFQIRVFDRITGAILLDEPLSTLFGSASGGDPYVVHDDLADRWYVSAFDSDDVGLFLAVSNDGNPLDGFKVYDLRNLGGFPDYNKLGYNKDAVFVSYNDFGSSGGAARILAIDKAAILGGTLTSYLSRPKSQFRAMPPAQMHGDTAGGVEWFVSTDGTDAGGSTIRVTQMTNYLSNSPHFRYASLPVAAYQNATTADQPGGSNSITTFPNTTTTQVHYRNGHLVTAMASATATDGFVYPKGLIYQIGATPNKKPKLLHQVVINPGPGVAVQMPSVDEDSQGNLGFSWMESSSTEYLSMWVGARGKNLNSTTVAAPGGGYFYYGSRIGDYSSTAIDPADGLTFWSANEYIGADGLNDIWLTHLTSFTAH